MGFFIVIFFIAIVLKLIMMYKINRHVMELDNSQKYKSLIQRSKTLLATLKKADEYIDNNIRNDIKNERKLLLSELHDLKIPKKSYGFAIYYDLLHLKSDLDPLMDSLNKEFIEAELIEYKDLFDNIDGKSLDNQQREAIVTDEIHNLVIAGAGSGKTLTISGKVKYLVDCKKVNPQDILLISFTKKAAEEMTERIASRLSIPVKSVTFHKLGIDIISANKNYRPEIQDNLEDIVSDYLRDSLKKNKAIKIKQNKRTSVLLS